MNPVSTEKVLSPVFSAARIAEVLAGPGGKVLTPTDEQQRVIEHPLRDSTLVIAGAGSGKTETMANRVVWLVANGLAAPDTILGLTFTRKAAGELRERIVARLHMFASHLTDLGERGLLSEREAARLSELSEVLADGLNLPDVNTYNAFAAGVLQEFGATAGLAPGAVVMDEAFAWRVAREVLYRSRHPELAESDVSVSTLIRHMIDMNRAAADHQTNLDRVDQIVHEFQNVKRLPYNDKEDPEKPSGKLYAKLRDATAAIQETPLITRLARDYAAEKEGRGLIDFADQLAFATRALESSPEALRTLRHRYRAVLLDEVQDTSVGQTRFLSRIFAGSPVMAVGDPHQSIYAWRGASAEGLRSFHHDFRGKGEAEQSATLTLSVSWRNPTAVLEAANIVSAELRAHSVVSVPKLQPRPGAETGRIECSFHETIHEEREQLATWMATAREEHAIQNSGALPTAAVIFRKRSVMHAFSEALTKAGVPNRIVGLGGLLSTPEITDIVSTLRCIWYADAGTELIRLLTGPRFRLGVADVAGLRDAARWFAQRDIAQKPLDAQDRNADSVLQDPDREFTLIDALDAIASIKDLSHASLKQVSDTGRLRLREAGLMLRSLRHGVGGHIADLITAVVGELRLDIELEANEARILEGDTSSALANIEAFIDLAEGFLAVDTHGTLQALLEWIERAMEDDEAAEHVPPPTPGTVQLITAHGSKGLEWDLVAIPRLVESEFPGSSRSGSGWLRTGELPDELRGDRAARPELNWRIATTQKELCDRIDEYREALKAQHADEERRLGYVAITRSAERLLLTGSFWGGQKKPRGPSVFLRELEEAGIVELPKGSAYEEDPSEVRELTATWPLDPLGRRAEAVLKTADLVRTEIESLQHTPSPAEGELDPTVRLLLAERDANEKALSNTAGVLTGELPNRITASTFHEFIEDPVTAEQRRMRPVPQRPYRRTRVGNRFHEWVERRATTPRGTSITLSGLLPEDWGEELAEFTAEPELQPLIEAFERSRWADLQPVAVELQVTLPFAGRSLVCKLDAVYRVHTPGESGRGDRAGNSEQDSGLTQTSGVDESSGAAEERFEIVDWKSGRAPATVKERESRFFQLDLYRHAYAQWAGIDPSRIDVSLFYVSEEVELRGEHTRSLEELEAIWYQAAEQITDSAAR